MRNLLDKSSIAQSLDGTRLMGSLPVPDAAKLVRLECSRKTHIRDRETSLLARSQRINNEGTQQKKRGAKAPRFTDWLDTRRPQLAACAGMSRWRFMTILLSAPR